MSTATLVIRIEGSLWDGARAWDAAVTHLAERFSRVRAFERPHASATGHDADTRARLLGDDARALAAWAGADIDWHRELTRFFDENLSRFVRPDRALNQVVRAYAREGAVHAVSALPEPAALALLRHVGLARTVAQVRGSLFVPGAVEVASELANGPAGATLVSAVDAERNKAEAAGLATLASPTQLQIAPA